MSDNKTWVKAYKGFDKDLKCRGRQYTEGVEDHVSDVARLCKEGVHACKRPLDVFEYYDPADSVYHEVELAGVLDEHKEDSKICGTDIKVKGKLDIAGLVNLSDYEWALEDLNKVLAHWAKLYGHTEDECENIRRRLLTLKKFEKLEFCLMSSNVGYKYFKSSKWNAIYPVPNFKGELIYDNMSM